MSRGHSAGAVCSTLPELQGAASLTQGVIHKVFKVFPMASCDYSHVTFVNICDDAFYFQETPEMGEDLTEDGFAKSPAEPEIRWVRSKSNQFLHFHESQFEVKNLDETELKKPDCQFNIQNYNDMETDGGQKGRPIMLYASIGPVKMVVCCKQDGISSEKIGNMG
ncbi:uncharacterized protein isoform X2 [Notothenia coriiceps]|uniref:Uncharacterized protein isoform X2 n=1 Tax=Notothenia coriiceps TaxID=8208 RepID=A0A6I9N5M5_9TELE|nr:PREDICTED: uncharacterized protein LOC104945633 isoform X2 [Notothenia coriiceps]